MIFILIFFPIIVFTKSPSVVFINPGAIDDIFFSRMVSFMQAAANDLDIKLKIIYTDRNYFKSFEAAEKVILDKGELPDYLILINENGLGEFLLPKVDKLGVKIILINEGFSKEKVKIFGRPKEKFKNWIIEYLPDDFNAGYLLAKELIDKAIENKKFDKDGKINIIGLLGTSRTTSSVLRGNGLKKAIEEYGGKVKLLQTVKADWDIKRAEDITSKALKRYDDISIIWSASDGMALGSYNAIKKLKKHSSILIGGIDWTLFSLDKVKNEDFTATVGGHFMDGAWALVLLYDDFNGVKINNRVMKSKFYVINKMNVHFFEKYFKKNEWNNLDFKKFSLFLNHSLKAYNFGYTTVIRLLKLDEDVINSKKIIKK